MFDIIVDVKVRLSSGATIELTEDQSKKIKNAALDVILGESVKTPEKTKQPKRAAYFHWNTTVDNELLSIVQRFAYLKPRAKSPERRIAMREFRTKYRLSRQSVDSRLTVLKRKMRKLTPTSHTGGPSIYSRPSLLES